MTIPLSIPELSGNEASYLQDCVSSNFVSSIGPYVTRFEREFAELCGLDHAVACSTGTAALHLALLAVGVRPGDLVLVSDFTFIASANAITYVGGRPVFVDSEPATWNLHGERLLAWVEGRAAAGRELPEAIVAVHIYGCPLDPEPLLELRERFGVKIIEDAAEAVGARYLAGPFGGRHVGALGDVACFSFNGNKLLTTGGGGLVASANGDITELARHLATQAKVVPDAYHHDQVGYNYRMTNLAAAVGCAQLERLDAFLVAKHRIARTYDAAFDGTGLHPQGCPDWAVPNHWLYSVQTESESQRDQLIEWLDVNGVQARPLWPPLHRQEPYRDGEIIGGSVSIDLYERGVSLPSSVSLTEDDQARVSDLVLAFLHRS